MALPKGHIYLAPKTPTPKQKAAKEEVVNRMREAVAVAFEKNRIARLKAQRTIARWRLLRDD